MARIQTAWDKVRRHGTLEAAPGPSCVSCSPRGAWSAGCKSFQIFFRKCLGLIPDRRDAFVRNSSGGISYRDLAEMMQERGVEIDPSTIFRWVQRYAPEIEKRVRRYQGHRSGSWRVDETYVRVGGKWKYLFRAVDKHGQLIDFMVSDRRNTRAAYRFLRKALRIVSDYPPSSITTDKLASCPKAIQRLQKEGLLSKNVEHRTSKYLNNIIEADQ